MPRVGKTKSDTVEIITLRLDKDTALYYRKRAKERGTTLSDFLRQTVVQGMIAETALDIEQRMRSVLAEMGQKSGGGGAATLPENVLMSLYTSEYLLTAIVEARNIQELYDAQNKAKAKIKREKGSSDV